MNAPKKTILKSVNATKRTVALALAVFVIASLVGFSSYQEIRSKALQSVFLLSNIKPGESKLVVKHAQQCIGTFQMRYVEGRDLSSIFIESKIFLNFNGKKVSIPINGQISINALLQVGGSFLEAKIGEESLFLGTQGVQPIELQFSIRNVAGSKSFTFPLQGPIVLKQNRDETYALVMRGSDNFNRLLHNSNPFSNLNYQMTLDSNNNCEGNFEHLDVSPIVRALESIQTAIPVRGNVQ